MWWLSHPSLPAVRQTQPTTSPLFAPNQEPPGPAVARFKSLALPTNKRRPFLSNLVVQTHVVEITPFLTFRWSPVGCSQPTNAFTSDPDSAVPGSRDRKNSEIGARSLTSPPNHWLRILISSLGWAGGANCFYLSTDRRALKRGIGELGLVDGGFEGNRGCSL